MPQSADVRATRTYLEMRDPAAAGHPGLTPRGIRLERLDECPASFYRYLYHEAGRRWHWTDRTQWTDDWIRYHLARPSTSVWLLSSGGAPAGFVELVREHDASVEIAYFGLLPEFIGRGLGTWFLRETVRLAWTGDPPPARVWLHTCTLDHPAALPNYLARGFRVFRTEEYQVAHEDSSRPL